MPKIMREWTEALPLRHQGVLVAAIRGCDGAEKENSAKPIVRAIRYAVLNPADEREVDWDGAFMARTINTNDLRAFLRDWDHYPIHYIQHLMHACQVIGYTHPERGVASIFHFAYMAMVDKLHLTPEDPVEMNARLTGDRIATNKM